MFGAASIVTSAASEATLSRLVSFAAAAADFTTGSDCLPDDANEADNDSAQALRKRLDYKPSLSILDHIVSIAIPAAICGILYHVTRPSQISPLYALGMAMIMAAWVFICRAVLLERYYAARLLPGTALGGKLSKFARLEGLNVHYKAWRPQNANATSALHCFHGFGANTGSWSKVHKQLADGLQAQVTLHDMPGFGLTERPEHANGYSLEFNGRLGRQIMDRELSGESGALQEASADIQGNGAEQWRGTRDSSGQPETVRRILMGHSLGGACAAAETIQNPEGGKVLILVAPAVMAYGFLRRTGNGKSGRVLREGGGVTVHFSVQPAGQPPVKSSKRPSPDNRILRFAIALAQSFMALISSLTTQLLQPVTIVTLRSAVRSRTFWEKGLARAWFDGTGVSAETVDSYRQPMLVQGWEKGLVRFAAARMAGGRSLSAVLWDAWKGKIPPTQVEKLAATVSKHDIKVLIVHGENDKLVPVSNSRRLAGLLPNARLVTMPNTGHVPHEERPHEFVRIVQSFLDESQ